MRETPHLPRRSDASADALLEQAVAVVARRPTEAANSWHRLHGRALGLRAARRRTMLVVHWRRVGLITSLAIAGVILASAVVRPPRTASPPVQMATRSVPVPVMEQGTAVPSEAPNPGTSREGWSHIDLPSEGQILASPSAAFHLPTPVAPHESHTVLLDRGELCAQVDHRDPSTHGAFIVQAPTIRAIAVGTRFCVFAAASPDDSFVTVEEGKVRVERVGAISLLAGPGALVHAGAAHVDDQGALAVADVPPAPVATEPPARATSPQATAVPSPCPSAPVEARERCLWRQAGGVDLAAQNALYLLGAAAREHHDGSAALSIWQTYRHRFPQGALTAETSWNIFSELVAERRFDEALSESNEFLSEHGAFFRVGEMKLRRAEILRDELGRPADAVQAYHRVLVGETRPAIRDEALFGLGRAQELLNASSEARATWERYQKEFPVGKHRAEVARRLGAE